MKYTWILLSALLMGFSQHSIEYGWLAWFSLFPFIKFLDSSEYSFKDGIYMSLIWGFTYHITVIFWMFFNLGMPTKTLSFISLLASVIILMINTVLIVILYSIIKKNKFDKIYFFLPAIWVSIEYVRTFSILGFPWISLANSQTNYILLAQNVEFTGIYGISFWIVLINVLIYDYYKTNKKSVNNKALYTLLIALVIPFISGYYLYHRQQPTNGNSINTVIVQPNISLEEKRNTQIINEIISTIPENSITDTTDLVLFPETAITYYSIKHPVFRNFISDKFSNQRTSLLSGMLYRDNENRLYNSAIHINSSNIDSYDIEDIYYKIKLVPLAEYNPFINLDIKSIDIPLGSFNPGDIYRVFNINNYQIAAMICYESTFPQLNRKFVNNGAEILIYFVNDGWYEDLYEPEQHARQSIYRAIEFRRPVIRCANTGISQVIDKKGNITQRLELNSQGVILANIIPSSQITFYAKYGDIFSIINMLLIFILLGMILKRKK